MVGRMAGTDGTVDSDRVEAYRETILDRATRHALHVARREALRVDAPRASTRQQPWFTTTAASPATVALHDSMQHRSHTRCDRAAEHIFRTLMSAESLITRSDRSQRAAW